MATEFGIEDVAIANALSKVRELDLLNAFEFVVDFPALPGADEVQILARRVTVPGFSFNVESREEGNRPIQYAMEESVDDLVIEVVEAVDSSAWSFFQGWRNRIRSNLADVSGLRGEADDWRYRNIPSQYKSVAVVTHLDRQLRPTRQVMCRGCFIKGLSSYTLDYTDDNHVLLVATFAVDLVEPNIVTQDSRLLAESRAVNRDQQTLDARSLPQ